MRVPTCITLPINSIIQLDFDSLRKMTNITKNFCHFDKNEFLTENGSIQRKLLESQPQIYL